MKTNGGLSNRELATIAITSVASSIALQWLGDDAWLYLPPAMFAGMVGVMAFDRRGPLTAKQVVLAAVLSIAVGAFLRIT